MRYLVAAFFISFLNAISTGQLGHITSHGFTDPCVSVKFSKKGVPKKLFLTRDTEKCDDFIYEKTGQIKFYLPDGSFKCFQIEDLNSNRKTRVHLKNCDENLESQKFAINKNNGILQPQIGDEDRCVISTGHGKWKRLKYAKCQYHRFGNDQGLIDSTDDYFGIRPRADRESCLEAIKTIEFKKIIYNTKCDVQTEKNTWNFEEDKGLICLGKPTDKCLSSDLCMELYSLEQKKPSKVFLNNCDENNLRQLFKYDRMSGQLSATWTEYRKI